MQLETIPGASCAQCNEKILVDLDGRNCKRCGLAIHRRCGKTHRESCKGKPALAVERHDYDEVSPIDWNTRLIVPIAAGVFSAAFGVGMLVSAPASTRGTLDDATVAAPAPSKTRTTIAWSTLAGGVVVAAAGFVFERSRQQRR